MRARNRIVIAEDHVILRQGLKSLMDAHKDLEVVAEAGDGFEAIRAVEKEAPDLLLLDLNMPRMDGISVIRDIKKRFQKTKIVVLTMHRNEEYILEAFQSGVDGYCLKASSHEELMIAIRHVLSGRFYVSPEISGKVLEGYLEGQKTIKEKSSWDTLTQREKEVLKLVGEGYQNKKIADYLCISVKTVEKHRSNVMEKLDLHNVSDLTAYAIEKGIVTR